MIDEKVRRLKMDFVVSPGVTLREALESINMTQVEFANRTGRPLKTINEIVNGTSSITPETAIQFERVLNIKASFWNNLEKNYQEKKALLKSKTELKEEVELAKKFPYNLISKLGWVNKTSDYDERIENLLGFFGVNSLRFVPNIIPVNYRTHLHNGKKLSEESIYAWLRKGEVDAMKIKTSSFNMQALKMLLPKIIQYSINKPHEFLPLLIKDFAEVGVALIFTPSLPNTYICGASRWLNPNKALIQLSVRGGFADIMWFTLYHEIGHIILHGKKERFIDLEKNDKDKTEIEADEFASEMILPKKTLDHFLTNNMVNVSSLYEFSDRLNLHVGIIIGRLQHEGKLQFNQLNNLRERYSWKLPH